MGNSNSKLRLTTIHHNDVINEIGNVENGNDDDGNVGNLINVENSNENEMINEKNSIDENCSNEVNENPSKVNENPVKVNENPVKVNENPAKVNENSTAETNEKINLLKNGKTPKNVTTRIPEIPEIPDNHFIVEPPHWTERFISRNHQVLIGLALAMGFSISFLFYVGGNPIRIGIIHTIFTMLSIGWQSVYFLILYRLDRNGHIINNDGSEGDHHPLLNDDSFLILRHFKYWIYIISILQVISTYSPWFWGISILIPFTWMPDPADVLGIE